MRILVVDDRPERASHLKSVLLQKVSANDVIMCRRASDVGDDQSCDFDFIILHFCNDLSEHGDYALAFMDGLISRGREQYEDEHRQYHSLGVRIGGASDRPSVLVYSGGHIDDSDDKRIRAYGEKVCVREWVGLEEISAELSAALLRAVSNVGVELEALCPPRRGQSNLAALLILCEGWLITNIEPETGRPDIEGGVSNPAYPELVEALEIMTGRSASQLPRFLSSILPPELRDRNRREEIREKVKRPGWWQVIAQKNLQQLIRQETKFENLSDTRLTPLSDLLALIESQEEVIDVSMVAKAYRVIYDFIGHVNVRV